MTNVQQQGRLIRSQGSSFLNSFWDLVSDDNNTREQASLYITSYLANTKNERNEHGKLKN